MGRAISIALGAVVGFVMGLVSMSYWSERAPRTAAPSATAEQDLGYGESYFMCKPPYSGRESALIIKSDGSGAKTMIFPWTSDATEFRVEQITDLFYKAVEASPKVGEAYGSLEFNRVSGELFMTARDVSNNNTVVKRGPYRYECRSTERRF